MAAEDIINQHVLNHFTIDTTDLVKNHPPRFQNGHKKLIYGLACPDGWRSHHGSLTCTRWKQLELPKSITFTVPEPTIVDGFFAYQPPSKGEELWFMNFADRCATSALYYIHLQRLKRVSSFVVMYSGITVAVCSHKTSRNVSNTQRCVLFESTSSLSPTLTITPYATPLAPP